MNLPNTHTYNNNFKYTKVHKPSDVLIEHMQCHTWWRFSADVLVAVSPSGRQHIPTWKQPSYYYCLHICAVDGRFMTMSIKNTKYGNCSNSKQKSTRNESITTFHRALGWRNDGGIRACYRHNQTQLFHPAYLFWISTCSFLPESHYSPVKQWREWISLATYESDTTISPVDACLSIPKNYIVNMSNIIMINHSTCDLK